MSQNMQEAYNAAINYAIDNGDLHFLYCWREGNWDELDRLFPDFKLDPALRAGSL